MIILLTNKDICRWIESEQDGFGPPVPTATMEFKRQGVTAMAYVIFFAGLFLGTIFGFVVMALLAVGSCASEAERHQPEEVISPGATLSEAS
jgi:hypothetical protein